MEKQKITTVLIGGAVVIVILLGTLILIKPEKAEGPTEINGELPGPVQPTNTEETVTEVSSPTETTPAATPPQQPVRTPTPKSAPTTAETTSQVPLATTTTTPSKAPFVTTVYYDGTDFIPETVTIIEGGTVVFENMSDRPMWIGSNTHPSHSKYPVKGATNCLGSSFDQCEATGKGSTWSFTFSELGEWKYHNHMRSVDGGEVIVLTKEKFIEYTEDAERQN